MADQSPQAPRIADHAFDARAVTAVSRFRIPGWGLHLRVMFFLAPRVAPWIAAPLVRLGVIHAARWCVVARLPSVRRPGARDRVRPGLLVFETNFDGAWRPYIEAFARIMPLQWTGIWAGTRGFPGPLPASGLLGHIEAVNHPADWSYTALGDTALQEITAALALDAAVEDLVTATAGADDERFATAWAAFLEEQQWRL